MSLLMEEKSFGERLRRLREAAGLTQMALAKSADVTLSSITQIEQGVIRDPRRSTLLAIARALGVTLDELAGEE